MHDASGLSQADRVPPALLVDILRMASDPAHPELRPIIDGLPVAGRTGTLAPRYHSADTRAGAGVVRAKSGRLLGMNALAGLVRTKNGRLLVFALRAPTADLSGGEQAMDRVATTLALCGCR
jgi:D-alanyl-D-alanine carboxypeptidase/D-alanyl-D-alanine-endopeptidase (penicillin-binding protein 4)